MEPETTMEPADPCAGGAERLIEALTARGRLAAADAREATGLPTAKARVVIRELMTTAQIRARGQGRGRTYALAR